ncbi:MAG: polysaccharide biosynthesis C-terminal domain-containing protein [Candidatus Omnitrophica bacterium]|nr:polysaccharide biosynthesis C-terminal domain-containing protein [Candidatus Omnitrophota bacterium]
MKKVFLKASFIIFLSNVLCYFFGYLKEALIVKNFGASNLTDAWYLVSNIPNFIFKFSFFGALSASFVPVFVDYLKKNKEREAWQIASSIINFTFLVALSVTIFCIIFSKSIIFIFAPGFDKNTSLVASKLLDIAIISLPFIAIVGFLESIYRLYFKYFYTAFSQLINAIVFIIFLNLFIFHFKILATSLSLVISYFFSFLFLAFILFKNYKNLYTFKISFFHPAFRGIFKLMLPLIGAEIIGKSISTVDGIFASFLDKGSITTLSLANRIINFPTIFIATTLNTAIFPIFANLAEDRKREEFQDTFDFSFKISLGLIFFVIIIFILFSHQIVAILFERGNFTHQFSLIAAKLILILSPVLISYSIRPILASICYSFKMNWLLFKFELLGFILNIILDYILMRLFGVFGIALATTIVVSAMVIYLFFNVKRKLLFETKLLVIFLVKITLASLLTVIFCHYLFKLFKIVSFSPIKLILYTFIVFLIYIFGLFLFKIEEIEQLWRLIVKKKLN